MSLSKAGSWNHPCGPWLDLHPDVARRLLPGGREATRTVLEARLRDLESWKAPPAVSVLADRVRRERGENAAKAFERVAQGEPVVLTGQQPSLGGGPLFVWLKAWSAIRHAERATQLLGRPVQALFWIAGDDSDLAEVRGLADPLQRLSFDSHGLDFRAPRQPVGPLPIPDDHRNALARAVFEAWPGTGLTEIVESSTTLSGILAACLRHWFGDRLLVVDAAWPELRGCASTLYREFARNPAGIHADLAAGMERARAAGLPVTLRSWPDRLRLFHWSDAGRARIVRDGERWSDGVTSWTDDSLQEALRATPERFSHDVASRPFAAETVFPVIAHVLGPGEFAYFACLGPLSSRLGRTLAPALPRASTTILPQGPWPVAHEAGWDPVRTPPPPIQTLQDALLEKRLPGAGLWPKLWSDARTDYLDILSRGLALPQLDALSRQLGRFEAKLRTDLVRGSATTHLDDIATLRHLVAVLGQGALQERAWSPWALEHHFGDPRLLQDLQSATDPVETVHMLWEHRP